MEEIDTQKFAQEAVELFRENEDGYFAVPIDSCTERPLRYITYDLEVAALDALCEFEAFGDGPMTFDKLKLMQRVTQEASLIIDRDELIQILAGRLAIVTCLNNYGGPGRTFNPN